jgi:hypothetical protein
LRLHATDPDTARNHRGQRRWRGRGARSGRTGASGRALVTNSLVIIDARTA